VITKDFPQQIPVAIISFVKNSPGRNTFTVSLLKIIDNYHVMTLPKQGFGTYGTDVSGTARYQYHHIVPPIKHDKVAPF
jgi:hypothetical protein